MKLQSIATSLNGVYELCPQVFSDARGFFFESFNRREFATLTGVDCDFVQDNHSRSAAGVLRGLHYQIKQPQGKLVRVVAGEIFDVAVDIRRRLHGAANPQFGQWCGTVLSATKKNQLWIPPGFAHGFLVMSDSAEVLYKTTDYWYPEYERSLRWDDPTIGIVWQGLRGAPLLAAKDQAAHGLQDVEETVL